MALADIETTIAVVEDDDSVRCAVGRVLRGAGFTVALFRSGEEFLANIGGHACVILDVQLPGLSGLEVESRLRTLAPAVPIVFCTGSVRPETIPQRIGATCLRKPVDDLVLLEAVVHAIQRGR